MKSIRNVSSASSSNPGSVYSIQKGKIPPQAVDLEEVVLGAMMIDKKGVDEVIDIFGFVPESVNEDVKEPTDYKGV